MVEVVMLANLNGQPALWGPIANHPLSSLFSSQPWTEAVARTYGFTVSASLTDDATPNDGVLFCHLHDLRGERLVCGPFADYCDPLVNDLGTWRELIDPLISLGVPITLRCL